MSSDIYSHLWLKSLANPVDTFKLLAGVEPPALTILLRFSLWMLLLPPLFSLIGAANFGWRLGAQEPLQMGLSTLFIISSGYLLILLFGLISTALISRWMATTYGASQSLGRHIALVTIVGQPLAIASMAHLFPDVLVNVLVLIPTMIWSMYLLYKGIPIALETPPERGMLMASSLVAWLLVAAVSLLGLSMSLWTLGVGPLLGV